MARTRTTASGARTKVAAKGSRYHHGDLRRALIEAALELVEEQGPSGITLREAARRAGVTHAAPYRHFVDKEALLAALAEDGFLALGEEIARTREVADPRMRLEAVGVAYVRFAMTSPAHFRVMFGAQVGDKHRYPSLMQADQAVFDSLCGAIAASQAAGLLPKGDPAKMGMVAWSMVHGVAALAVDGQMDRAGVHGEHLFDLARRVVRTAFEGLARSPLNEPRTEGRG